MIDRLIVNWPLKLLSVAIAFGIWLSVTGEARVVQDFPVPLDVSVPADRIATVDLPNTVTVRLRGPESVMRRLDPLPMGLSVDLPENVAPGPQELQLLADHVAGVPRGVDVEFVDPARLDVDLEERAQKVLPVEPTFLGQPPEGFTFYGAQVRPEQVTVEGPASQIDALTEASTNAIRLDQRSQLFVTNVGVALEGDYVQMTEPGTIRVVVDVGAAPVERAFPEVPVRTRRAVSGVSIEPAVVDLVLSGPPNLLDRLNRERIRLLVDPAGLEPREEPYELAIAVEFNDIPVEETGRLTVKSISRRAVTVRLADRRTNE